jgi:hypothetical protein
MRTTLTIDDKIAQKLKNIAHDTGKSYKQVVNETLRAGMQARGDLAAAKPYRLKPESLGEAAAGYDLVKALALAEHLEDAEIVRELEMRK